MHERPAGFTRRVAAGWAVAALACMVVAGPVGAQHYLHASDIDALPSRAADYRVAYGPDSLEFGELRLPSAARPPYPVAVIIHGGCWVARYATVHNTAPLADALTAAGIATWNIEYRTADRPGGGWPGTFLDVGRAVDYIRTLAPRYGLDTTRVVVMGHSAGGQLALWVAARRRLPAGSPLASPMTTPLPLNGVVALAGPPDLTAFYAPDTAACGEGVAELLGGPPDRETTRALDGSPDSFFPLGVRQAWLAGVDDHIVPPAVQLAPYADAARRAGDQVTLTVIPHASHFELIAPSTPAYQQVLAAVLAFVRPGSGPP